MYGSQKLWIALYLLVFPKTWRRALVLKSQAPEDKPKALVLPWEELTGRERQPHPPARPQQKGLNFPLTQPLGCAKKTEAKGGGYFLFLKKDFRLRKGLFASLCSLVPRCCDKCPRTERLGGGGVSLGALWTVQEGKPNRNNRGDAEHVHTLS